MCGWLLIAGIAAALLALAHHLGLVERAAEVAGEIAKCPLCTAFWGVLLILLLCGCYILTAIALALPLAYLSVWLAIPMRLLNKAYNKMRLWRRKK